MLNPNSSEAKGEDDEIPFDFIHCKVNVLKLTSFALKSKFFPTPGERMDQNFRNSVEQLEIDQGYLGHDPITTTLVIQRFLNLKSLKVSDVLYGSIKMQSTFLIFETFVDFMGLND